MPSVGDFGDADLEHAADALAGRHRRDRARFPILPRRFEDPAACREIVAAARGYAEGVAARGASGLLGFAFGIELLPAPASPPARYGADRGTMLFAHGHAVASDADAPDVYGALYATLAARWVRRGLFDHVVHVPAGDPALEAAWSSLGFGRSNAVAARDLEPLDGARTGKVDVRRATPEDLASVGRLVLEEARYHARPPIFRPYLARDTNAEVRKTHEQALADDAQAIFLARERGHDVGITWIGPARGSPLFIPEGAAYIGDTAVVESARGAGVGAALVDRALAWARERGHRAVTLHYATANARSRSFWTGLGFTPVMWHLRRRLDERIAWASPDAEGSPSA